jgi:hypothetical protein
MSKISAHIRTAKDCAHDKWVNSLVIVINGKSLPHLPIPDYFEPDALEEVLEKLNAKSEALRI